MTEQSRERPQWPQAAEPTPGEPLPLDAVASGPAEQELVLAPVLPASGHAVAGMILGITSIVFCWWGLASLAQIVLAFTFGGIGLAKANRGQAGGRGMAIAGIACGCVGFVFYLITGIATLGFGFVL
jgi:hypothetical protein